MKIKDFFNQFRFAKKLESEAARNCRTIVDLGCGSDSPLKFFSKRFEHSLGIDGHAASVEVSKKAQIHDEYLVSDIMKACISMADNSFDCAVALDLIEHLDKANGRKLIDEMSRLARKRIIIYTPNGFLKQNPTADNPAQEHISGWSAEEMKSLGFKVYGMSGFKFLRKELGEIRFWPKPFWRAISSLTQIPAYYFPGTAFQILCVKELDKS